MNRLILGVGCWVLGVRRLVLGACFWVLGVSISVAASPFGGGMEGASPHHDWEDQSILQINREPARADFHHAGEISLNGEWKFNWTKTPDEQPDGFWTTDFDDSQWKTFPVPADWEMNGYGTPIYSSSGYTFKINPPYVMTTPKERYTAYVERNPTGVYRRTFTIPEAWKDKEVYIHFGSVSSAFYVWVNGQRVGYSQGSMEPAEFRITPFINPSPNPSRGRGVQKASPRGGWRGLCGGLLPPPASPLSAVWGFTTCNVKNSPPLGRGRGWALPNRTLTKTP